MAHVFSRRCCMRRLRMCADPVRNCVSMHQVPAVCYRMYVFAACRVAGRIYGKPCALVSMGWYDAPWASSESVTSVSTLSVRKVTQLATKLSHFQHTPVLCGKDCDAQSNAPCANLPYNPCRHVPCRPATCTASNNHLVSLQPCMSDVSPPPLPLRQ